MIDLDSVYILQVRALLRTHVPERVPASHCSLVVIPLALQDKEVNFDFLTRVKGASILIKQGVGSDEF